MRAKCVSLWALSLIFSVGPSGAEIDIPEVYSAASAQALTQCVRRASSAESVFACATPYLFRCLEILDESLFEDCRRTALFWWNDRVEEARELDPVAVKQLELKVERMPCSDFTLLGDYGCQERKYGVIYTTVMAGRH